eukprot:GDKI01002474.1.p1 GENE.GDKI01002474.1~~GDKI01002474.1.p1  ORF type:complete len:427 (+),score=115.80 GDKI01002474.1:142-1422(+)
MSLIWLGIALSCFGSACGALGDTCLRLSYLQLQKQEEETGKRMSVWCSPLWLAGMVLGNFCSAGTAAIALYFTPAEIVSPIAGLHIIFNVLFATLILKEKVLADHIYGSVLVLCGLVPVLMFGARPGETDAGWEQWSEMASHTPFRTYLCVWVVVLLVCRFVTINAVVSKKESPPTPAPAPADTHTHRRESVSVEQGGEDEHTHTRDEYTSFLTSRAQSFATAGAAMSRAQKRDSFKVKNDRQIPLLNTQTETQTEKKHPHTWVEGVILRALPSFTPPAKLVHVCVCGMPGMFAGLSTVIMPGFLKAAAAGALSYPVLILYFGAVMCSGVLANWALTVALSRYEAILVAPINTTFYIATGTIGGMSLAPPSTITPFGMPEWGCGVCLCLGVCVVIGGIWVLQDAEARMARKNAQAAANAVAPAVEA